MAFSWLNTSPAFPALPRAGKFGGASAKARVSDEVPKGDQLYTLKPVLIVIAITVALFAALYTSDWRGEFFTFRLAANGALLASLGSAIALMLRYAITHSNRKLYVVIAFAMTTLNIVLFLVVLPMVTGTNDSVTALPIMRIWGSFAVRVIFPILLTIAILAEENSGKELSISVSWFTFISLLLITISFALMAFADLPQNYHVGPFTRLQEILPLMMTLLAGFSIVMKNTWRSERLLFHILALVILHAAATIYLLFTPIALHATEVAAYALFGIGFSIPFFSIITSMYGAYRYAEIHRIREKTILGQSATAAQELSPTIFREISEQLNEALAITDPLGRILFVNPYLTQLTGYTPEQLLNKDLSVWQHSSMAADFYPRLFARLKKEKKMYEGEVKNAYANNRTRSYNAFIRVTPVMNEFGEISSFVVQQRDISEEQQRLHLLRQMIDTMPVGVLLVEVPSMQISLINAQAEYLLTSSGYFPTDIKTLDQIAARFRTAENEVYTKDQLPPYVSMQIKNDASAENIALFAEGSKKPTMIWKMKSTPFFREDGRIQYLLISFEDITRHKEFEHKMSDFISVASHQLRTPLTSIKWSLDTLRKKESALTETDRTLMFDTCFQASERMMVTIQQLLQVAEIERGNAVKITKQINIIDSIEEVKTLMKLMLEKKKLTLKQSVLKSIPPILANPTLVSQVVQNLMDNAVKYTPEGGEIDSILTTKNNRVEWTLHDTGIGIPKASMGRLFEKFFRSDNAQRANPDGTGLGLYIVKSTVEALGGTVKIESEEGVGTTVYISLPIAPKEPSH